MRWPPARSRSIALMALALGILPWTTRTSVPGQEARPPARSDPEAKLEKRIEDLEKTIRQHVEAGRIAEAVPPAREKLDLLARLRGTDHCQTGDARRDAETYERIAALPRGRGSVRGGSSGGCSGRTALRASPVRSSFGAISANPRD